MEPVVLKNLLLMSTEDKTKILGLLQKYLETATDNGIEIKQELENLIKPESTSSSGNAANLADAISVMKLSNAQKMPKFAKGENFARYCEKFLDYVQISNMSNPNLFKCFLQNVDDETYSTLKAVELTSLAIKSDPSLFIPLYKSAIYGSVKVILRDEVLECKQDSTEDIAKYVSRLSEKASIAYPDSPTEASEISYIAFLRGICDMQLRRKLNEATTVTTFNEAVALARRLEQINNKFDRESLPIPILKETVSFRPKRDRHDSTDEHNPKEQNRSPSHEQRYSSRSPSHGQRYSSQSPSHGQRYSSRSQSNKQRYSNQSPSREQRYTNSSEGTREYRGRTAQRENYNDRRNNYNYSNRSNSRDRYKNQSNERYGHQSKSPNNYRTQSPWRFTSKSPNRFRPSNNNSYSYRSNTPNRSQNQYQRRCWTCNRTDHISMDCHLNKPSNMVKACHDTCRVLPQSGTAIKHCIHNRELVSNTPICCTNQQSTNDSTLN